MVILLNADNIAVSSSGTTSGSAAAISVDSTKFSKNLSISDINVQHALETLDQLTAGNGSGTVTSVQTVLPDVNGNVDLTNIFINTSNVASSVAQGNNNPISSNAVYTSLLSKVDAVYGKVLSTNDYTTTDKEIVSGLSLFNPNTKVDKEAGKYLFSGSYNDLSDKPAFQAQLGYTPENIANKGVANGYVPTNSANKVDAQYLPSYVDDFLEFTTFADFPVIGDTGIVYLDIAQNKQYRWSGSQYSIIAQSPGSSDSVIEGSTNLYFTNGRVLSTVLSGINTSTIAVISNTDTVLTALGKLQAQISNKVDIVSGKGLSDQNYTLAEKNKLATLVYVDISSLQTQIDNKVDKVIGKDLFSGSYADLTNKPIVDSVVTQDSTHLITSGAVYTAVANISGGGGGNVNTVNNVQPDINKNVALTAENIPETDNLKWLTSTLKSAYDGAVSWISTNGTNLLNHIGDGAIHVTSALKSNWTTAYNWVNSNGTNVTTHISDSAIHVTANQKTAWTSDQFPIICTTPGYDIVASATVAKLRFTFQENRTLASIPIGELTTAAVGGLFTVDIKKNGVSFLSTLLTFDSGESTTRTAVTPAVLTGTISFVQGDYIDIYVTNTGSGTPGQGLQITLPLTK